MPRAIESTERKILHYVRTAPLVAVEIVLGLAGSTLRERKLHAAKTKAAVAATKKQVKPHRGAHPAAAPAPAAKPKAKVRKRTRRARPEAAEVEDFGKDQD